MSTATINLNPSNRSGIGYYGGLDGIRALAIVAVLLYHGGVVWAGGGFLGVEAFFVLSGFLITSLLIAEWRGSATIALRAFWARRARRLLPALFCMVAVVGLHEALSSSGSMLPDLRGDGIATLFYYGNWHEIATQSNYFAATGPVSPLQHTWSLAIEEQFYLLWPALLLAAIWIARRTLRGSRPTDRRVLATLLAMSVILALASAVEAIILCHGGAGANRVYYGTDTRAVSLLTGASLAFALAIFRRPESPGRTLPRTMGSGALGWGALLALSAVLALMHYADGQSPWLYPFGMVGLDLAVAVIIAAIVLRPGSVAGRIFSVAPARRLGQISYGVYLWHFPLFLWLTAASTGMSGAPLLIMRLWITLLVSVVSYVLIEQPVRRRKLPNWLVAALAPAAMGTACAALFAATAAAAPPVATPPLPKPPPRLVGTQTCRVTLTDTKQYGLSPMSPAVAAVVQPKWLVAGELTWSSHSRVTFHTCPPKRVMLIGDSLAFSLGLGQMIEEHNYGVEVANAAILGSLVPHRRRAQRVRHVGVGAGGMSGCARPMAAGRAESSSHRPWSSSSGTATSSTGAAGQRDAPGPTRVRRLRGRDRALHAGARGWQDAGPVPVGPVRGPAPSPDGSPSPAASPARHAVINSLLRSVAGQDPTEVRVLNIDRVVSPGNRYQREVNGKLCRFDGIHFAIVLQ